MYETKAKVAEKIGELLKTNLEYVRESAAERGLKYEISKDFISKIAGIAVEKDIWIPGRKVLEQIFDEWELWAPFVEANQFQEFFNFQLTDLVTIHTCGTNSLEWSRVFIGKKVKLKEEGITKWDTPLSTTINMKGVLNVNGRQRYGRRDIFSYKTAKRLPAY